MRADPDWKAKAVSPEDAVNHVKSGMKIFIHGAAATPTPLLKALSNRRDLEDVRLYHLHVSGVITNRFKRINPNRITTGFVNGTKRLYDFVHDNPTVEFHPSDRVNDTALIRQNDKMIAINSALEIDLTGQVCADSLGHRIYSGIGGQMDFIRGAALSRGGKPILALPSTANDGKLSRITHELLPGAGVVTTRGHVHWVVTEYGAANLHGMTLRERAEALIALAHPDFRAELRREIAGIRHFAF